MMHKAWGNIEEVPYYFSSSCKFQGHTRQKNQFWPKLGISGLLLQLEFTGGYEMMHKAWSNIVFQGYPLNFKGTWDQKLPILTWI